ncbi:hypothetical protein C0993_002280 [Termitomyces sp. T159_Od127]|nr:hypothetical protein C0993_002280 [Termitomyces sp. T159_Od127]
MVKVELVTDKCPSGLAVNEGGENLRRFAKSGIEDKQPSGLQAELWGSVGMVGSADWGGDIEGNGLQGLHGLVVKVEGEVLPINVGVGGAEPGETQDKGGGSMQTGYEQPEVLLLTIGKGEGGLHVVGDVTSGGGAAVKEGEADGKG